MIENDGQGLSILGDDGNDAQRWNMMASDWQWLKMMDNDWKVMDNNWKWWTMIVDDGQGLKMMDNDRKWWEGDAIDGQCLKKWWATIAHDGNWLQIIDNYWKPFAIIENHWKSMTILEIQRKSIEANETKWKSLDIIENTNGGRTRPVGTENWLMVYWCGANFTPTRVFKKYGATTCWYCHAQF